MLIVLCLKAKLLTQQSLNLQYKAIYTTVFTSFVSHTEYKDRIIINDAVYKK